ncbi:MAG: [protein-PII] uridylyltransferase [Alphaproteobacteria bacterium]|nr:[protein-PII] uridylyltransferase [Alphaproteobacteria bacterium]
MDKVDHARRIIDRKALAEKLAALADEHEPQGEAQRREALLLFKAALAAGREELKRRLEAGEDGPANAQARAYLIDQILRAAYDFVVAQVYPLPNPTSEERLAVVAVGGYGRGELAPFSDIDLMFLFPYKPPAWGEQAVEWLLYLLWDLGLKVGHSTRSVEDALRLAHTDHTICTALLEARAIYGDESLFAELRRRFAKEVQGKGGAFVEAKLAERNARHQRLGDTRYLVEPNLKEGKGGLRDLHTLFWIAKFAYRVDDLGELAAKGVLTAEELRQFHEANAFLWTVRCHLHTIAGRAEERLSFDMQLRLAERLGFKDEGGVRGVERFMKRYFLVAKDVGDLTRIICAAIEDEHRKKPLFSLPRFRLGRTRLAGFQVERGRLRVADREAFRKDPAALIRLFRVAQEHELDIHPDVLRQVRRSLDLIDDKLRADAEANRLFLETLMWSKGPEIALTRLNEAGVFGRFVPEFGRVVAQMQHDMYHHFTVDEHTIRAVGVIAAIERGDLKTEIPLASRVIHEIHSRRVLYLAVFLHDIAKGRGGDHSVLGAETAMTFCPRFGLSEAETEVVAWLVRHHLAMSSIAFKRDLGDPKTVADFVGLVKEMERLRLLLCLTVADIRAVGPNVWNGWKAQLLRELYWRAEERMTGGHTAEGRDKRVAATKAGLRERLADWPAEEAERVVARLPANYWLSNTLDTQLRHAELMRQADRDGAPLAVDRRIDPARGITEITIYTEDHPGIFMRIAGAMAVSGANIVDARIVTTLDGKALDTFIIQDATGGAFDRPDRLARLVAAIEQTLAGRMIPHRLLAEGKAPVGRSQAFEVAPVVIVDNRLSNTATVIEVSGHDRRGLLHDLTRALYDLNLSIVSARIATYGERAADTFYVRDIFGLKVEHEGKIAAIRARLLKALAEPGAKSEKRRAHPRDEAADQPPA